jgi:site-specific DNA-methyltransferase (adenine-specific)
MLELNRLYNMDCMEGMKQFPDKYFELAIVDPPYGIGISSNPVRQAHEKKKWDNATPSDIYFAELFRVSKKQIIWGGNYFNLPPCKGFIVWDKRQPFDFSMAMCEFAWSNYDQPAKLFQYSVLNEKDKIHPTQKPVKLYAWLLNKYAKQGDKILDTHVGSASSLIACYNYKFDYIGFEIDKDYYEAAQKRMNAVMAQVTMF